MAEDHGSKAGARRASLGENQGSSSSSDLSLMRLPRILNDCHPISGFVYGKASFDKAKKSILVEFGARCEKQRVARY